MKKVTSFLFLIFLVFTIISLTVSCGKQSTPTTSKVYTPTPVLVPQVQNLVNGMITVKAGAYYYQAFSINLATMRNVTVNGSFMASGGSGSDIIVYILDELSFTNWSTGHQVNTIYNSGQLTVANINTSISVSGKYYLVFDNTFSTFSSKDVTTKVDLNWSELKYQ
jgi:hypothetical protein